MHEMSITQGIIDLCLEHAGGRRVSSLDIEIGELGSVVPEAIEFCFEACSRETLLEGARLNIIRVPGSGMCQECRQETPMTELFGSCRHCGSNLVSIVTGEELRVREIEVDD
ncbi:MAG: hydrogenase maturation nickel metallochaperone HypA [Geobacteraceae bacterium GWB2_52_12]|nr:MAG: hydrogenase maturation nickel metallochaperone HypA [Geobacteraceae bacterium GWB2_52_12]